MGLNIIAYRITGVEEIENWSGRKEKYLHTENYKQFDSLLYSGDRDFVSDNEFQKHPGDGDDFNERYYRPKDLEKTKSWVRNTDKVPEFNKPRLIKLIDDMEKDLSIYLCFSR